MWYKAFNEFPVLSYDSIGLVNDSCILFKNLDSVFNRINEGAFDYCGLTDSNAISYHIQSYFTIINKNAIKLVHDYFSKHGIYNDLKDVIKSYEVGLSTHLLENQMTLGACFSTKDYKGEYNPMLYMTDELIERGIPMIKKKIIFCSFRKDEFLNLMRMNFNLNPQHYMNHIKQRNQSVEMIDFNKVMQDNSKKSIHGRIKLYKFKSFFFQHLRKLKYN